jgi:hypothetical protein
LEELDRVGILQGLQQFYVSGVSNQKSLVQEIIKPYMEKYDFPEVD